MFYIAMVFDTTLRGIYHILSPDKLSDTILSHDSGANSE